MTTFNDLLRREKLDPASVKLVRHHDTRQARPTVQDLWLAGDGRFELYQKIQGGPAFKGARSIASFVVTPSGGTLFVGIFSVEGVGKAKPGLTDPLTGKDVSGFYFYDLKLAPALSGYRGHLMIDWGKGFRAWIQRAHKQDKRVITFGRDEQLTEPAKAHLEQSGSDRVPEKIRREQELRDFYAEPLLAGAVEVSTQPSKHSQEALVTTITRPAALIRQGSLKLYATSLKVADLKLPNFYTINTLDPEEAGPGYQRLLNQGRAKRLAEYLLDGQTEGDAFLPTSIFLATNKDIAFDASTNTITFDVTVVGPFNVVDGQHRIAGLVLAADKNSDLMQFEIPVNIGVNLNDVSQMCHFLIVNTTQRSVDKAVEQQIVARLTKMINLEEMPTIPRWIRRQVEKGEDARALLVANHLNTSPNSVWFGKIRMANDDDSASATINQKSFVTSLKKYIFASNNPLSNPDWDTNRPAMLLNYWNAVVELLVDKESARPSIIFKTTGVDLFHIVSATVFTYLANQKDFKKETIKKLLLRGFSNLNGDNVGIQDKEWWQRGGVASGLNTAAVRKLATALNHAIHIQDSGGSMAL
jgi:DGQHR domain-containing protein